MGKCARIGTVVFLSLFLMMASCWWEGVKGPYLCRSGSMSNHSAHLDHCFLLLILVSKLSAVPGISSVHEVHIWELISGKIIATLHIKYQRDGGDQDANRKVREVFHNAGIHNVTIQFEQADLKEPLERKDLQMLCSFPCVARSCAKQLCCPPGALPLAHVNGCAEHNGCPPLDLSQSDGLGRLQATEVAVEVSLEDHGQALGKPQEDSHYVNSTHF